MPRPWKWEFKRNMSVLVNWAFGTNYPKFVKHFAYLSENGTQDLYWDANEAKVTSDGLSKKILTDPKFFQKQCRDLDKTAKELERTASQLMAVSDSWSDAQLLNGYRDYASAFQKTGYYVLWIRAVIDQGPAQLQKRLQGKTNDVSAAMSVLTATPRKSFMVEEEESVLALAEKINKDPNRKALFSRTAQDIEKDLAGFPTLQKGVMAHYRKFRWIPVGYGDEDPWTLEDCLNALRKALKEDIGSRKKDLETYAADLERQKKSLIQRLGLDEPTLRLADALSDCVYYKDYLRGVMNRAQFESRPLFGQIGRRLGLSVSQVKTFLPAELAHATKTKSWDPQFFANRKHYVAYGKGGKLVFENGPSAKKLQKQILDSLSLGRVAELRGTGAMAGLVQGPVRIISNPALVHRHDRGFILVTSMTTPDFAPVIKRALAVVTDEGGITCHAAIVSRELGVPCVVGTKAATQTFQNGDLIEVDGAKGLVRKINSTA